MLLYRLTLYPNGHLDGKRVNTDDIEAATLSPFEPLFDAGPSFNSAMPQAPGVAVKWTGSESGQALLTCSYQGKLFLSGALVAGSDPEGDAEILRMFTQSLESVPLLRQITGGGPNPLAALEQRPERPLLAAVLWPTLPAETFAELAGIELLLASIFLRRFGSS